jgi:Flp pilus assembly pilin Flp
MSPIVKFLQNESGVTPAEYALIFSLIALTVVASSKNLSAAITTKLSTAVTTSSPTA